MSKPIAWFDLETTSAEPTQAKIVQMSIVVTDRELNIVDGPHQTLINPEIPIPKGASDVHGILDEHVVNAPNFKTIAEGINNFLKDKDWGFYNGIRFDSTVLLEEFNRVGIEIDLTGINFIDPMIVFHKKEPRDLTAALKFYTGQEMSDAHDATADILATIEVARGQIKRYEDVSSVDDMITLSEPEKRCDIAGKFVMEEGVPVFTFGQHRGNPISTQLGFLNWMLDKDFPTETKQWIRKFLENGIKK